MVSRNVCVSKKCKAIKLAKVRSNTMLMNQADLNGSWLLFLILQLAQRPKWAWPSFFFVAVAKLNIIKCRLKKS